MDDELYNRHNSTSIFIMALEAIRKAVTFHHTRISAEQVKMMDGLRSEVCAKMRDYPGGTLAIRTRNIIADSAPALATHVVYRVPAAPGSRREAREKRRRERREARRKAGRENGTYYGHSLSFFGYNTDASDDEEVTSTMDGPSTDAPRRKKRVRRSLITRLSYYPPRNNEPRQVVLDFLNLEEEGADFIAPIDGEEFRQGDDDGGDTSEGMDSDFDDSADPLPIPPYGMSEPEPEPENVPDAGANPFSPTTATAHLVQSLSVTDRYPLALPPSGQPVWTLGFGSLAGAAPIVPDADAAAAAMWQATEAAWDTVPADHAPFVPPPTDQVPPAPPPWPTSPEPANGMPANAIFDLNAAAASMMRLAPTPPPTIVPVSSLQAQQLVSSLCTAMISSGCTPAQVAAAYLTERDAPGSHAGYASLLLPSERESFRQLHATIDRTLEIMASQEGALAASQLPPGSPMPPAPPASAPPSLAPGGSRVNVINLPGLGTHRIEQNGGGLPPTFTSRGRMKRQREAQAATAAAIAEAHAAAAAHAAREQQQTMADDTLVAGPSVSFDHDRRKARRLVDENPSSPAPATSVPPAEDSSTAAQSLQRVLGAVVQHPSSASAAATASVHSSSCPCVYCPSSITNRPRPTAGLQALAPPGSQNILGQPPLAPLSAAEMDQTRRQQTHQLLMAQLHMQQRMQLQSLAMLQHPPPPPPPQTMQQSQHSQQQAQSFLNLLHPPALRFTQPVATPTAPMVPQGLLDAGGRQIVNPSHRQQIPTPNITGPTLPRMDLPFYHYTPMSYLSVAQPAPMPPPSFVDLPDANQVMSRQHMFNPAASSLSTAAAAALAVARSDVQRQGVESMHDQQNQLLEQWISLNNANREFHALRQYLTGIPPGGEAAPIGAAQRDIDKYSVTQTWRTVEGADVDPCTVCMNEFEEGENVRKLTCNHAFHVHCIDPWLSYNKKCPNCRIDLDQAASAGSVAAPPAAPAAPTATPAAEAIDDQAVRVARSLHVAAQQQLLNEMRIQQNEAIATAAAEAETRFATGLNTAPTTGAVMANSEL